MRDADRSRVGGRIVRPYTMTGGRTATSNPPIALEALVSATTAGMRMRRRFRWESAEIIERSRRATAIVELAALLEVPIGVVRVLADDLQAQGAVTINDPAARPVPESDGEQYADLLNKVLDGIKSL